MKHVRSWAMAAVAAMALMAFLGASSASATVLCRTQLTSNCSASGWDYPAGTVFDMSMEGSSEGFEVGTFVINTCTAATFKGSTSNTGSSTVAVSVLLNTLIWGEVRSPCTKTMSVLTTGKLEIEWIEGTDSGTLKGSGTEWTTQTVFGSCVYGFGASTDLGTLTGGNPATVDINTVIRKISGSTSTACPEELRWTANFSVTEPVPIYVESS